MLRASGLAQGLFDACVGVSTSGRSSRAFSSGSVQHSVTACLDATRAVVRLKGSHTVQFLQGLLTNDVRTLETPGAAPVYGALLTPKGKFLHDVILYRQADGSLLMDVDGQGKQRALDWLTRYKLRKQVTLDDVSQEQAVYVSFGPGTPAQQEGWWPDPRLISLGLRTIQPHGSIITASGGADAEAVRLQQYRTWRHMHGVAEGEVEIPTDKAAPLDYNLDVLQGVSYKKGCYIGQERNSFTHYRGIIRKRCMPFRFDTGDGKVPIQGESVVTLEGETAGTVQGVSGGYGLLYARLKPALAAAAGETELRGKQSGVKAVPFKPGWWDESWGREEEGEGAQEEGK